MLRVLAGVVLAPLTLAAAYFGGWWWIALATLAAAGMYAEWLFVTRATGKPVVAAGIAPLAVAGLAFAFGWPGTAWLAVATGLIAVMLTARVNRAWAGAGLIYAAAALFGAVAVRADPQTGFTALLFVLLIVWATDIGGYFAGRSIGGPKLWVRVSPKKTWAGAIGGFAGSLAVAAGFAAADFGRVAPLMLLAAVLSVVSQLGDLFESAVKRRFGVKDSSNIIPGHGGLLDRLDGFVAAIVTAAAIGVLRGGWDAAGRGLMMW
ncbi:MAG: phosphatidate cytidylyltransferase [Xanthobacteraceae bacterium]|nr:phosphatidate cytidylyltransferase [Xanthobacteraceae bacterium]